MKNGGCLHQKLQLQLAKIFKLVYLGIGTLDNKVLRKNS